MNVLSVGGSDPSSGAGIQSDLKTFMTLGVYGLTVVTAITSQNTSNYTKTEAVSPQMIRQQIDSIFSDFEVDAIKIGMVYNNSIIEAIHSKLKNIKIPIVLDPVIRSTTNGTLLEKSSLSLYKKLLIPLSYVITPNVFEAQKLSDIKITSKKSLLLCAKKIQKLGAKNVIITGSELSKGKISDFVLENSAHYIISGRKISIINHGSGCNYSASLAAYFAKGKSLREAARFAKNYAFNSIKNSEKVGKGISITIQKSKHENDLSESIVDFQNLKNSFKLIPECQTNFVFSKEKSKTIHDVLGISGRIVKAGDKTVLVGSLEFGGSQHVASALLGVRKKFPQIRSAINIKYDPKLIQKFRQKKFHVLFYDRVKEPTKIKNKENLSVSWGTTQAIKNADKSPDVIFHKGDIGKEPMILVFGKNPKEVVEKISSVL